jgi:MCM P-loop domain
MIRLLAGGQYVVAETASMVGLSAMATQTTAGWFVEWGPLVLCDRRLLAIDGGQKLPKNDWLSLAESQRLGTVKLTKAAKGEAPARTRTTIIAKPLDLERYEKSTKEMSAFLYPYMALPTIMDIQSVARLDLAVFVNAGDVTAEEINSATEGEPDAYLFNLKDLRAFVWEGKYKVEHDAEFVTAIHSHATALYNKFHVSNVPLVSIDMKFKLVRLSTALALVTCSFKGDSFDTVVVTKEHVDYVAAFLGAVYTNAGLHEGARKDRQGDVDRDQVQDIIDKVCEKIGADKNKVIDMLKWMALQPSFSRDLLQSIFDLRRDPELRPLVSILQNDMTLIAAKFWILRQKPDTALGAIFATSLIFRDHELL